MGTVNELSTVELLTKETIETLTTVNEVLWSRDGEFVPQQMIVETANITSTRTLAVWLRSMGARSSSWDGKTFWAPMTSKETTEQK